MKIIIVEPFLKNQSGHQYIYTKALHDSAEKEGMSVYVFANENFQKGMDIKNVFANLTTITDYVFNSTKVQIINFFHLINLLKTFSRKLDDLFLDKYVKLDSNDIIFCHTLYLFEYVGLGLTLKKYSNLVRNKNIKIIVGFNFSPNRSNFISTGVFKLAYKIVDRIFFSKINVLYCSDGIELCKEYNKIFNKNVFLVPVPMWPFIYFENIREIAKEEGDIRITFIGGARYNKGFDIFVDVMEIFLKRKKFFLEKIKFCVQIDIHERQSNRDKKVIKRSVEKLESLLIEDLNVEIIRGALDTKNYYSLLFNSDIILMPYRDVIYRSTPSNIFVETILANKIPIVPEGTTMANVLLKEGLEELIYKKNDIINIVNIIYFISNSIKYYQNKIKKLSLKYRQYHNAKNLVNILVNIR